MTTLTAPVWLLVILAALAVCGLIAATAAVAAGLEQVRDWWRDRRSPNPDYDGDGWDQPDDGPGDDDDLLPPLPPERTWEQMTSHQLPLERALVGELERQGWFDADVQARLRAEYEARHAPERERRAPWWEAEHRAAYESLGFDYPSGLMARVRELAP